MKAATIAQSGAPPVYGDIAEPPSRDGLLAVEMKAAALSHVAKSRASGRHYSAEAGQHFVPGVDGVGVLKDGRRVYLFLPEAPHGSMAEWSLVDPNHCLELPDNVSDTDAAALAIPGMSSWAALRERAHFAPGGTVLVNGATGTSGSLAVQVARRLGAKKVIATGRHAAALAQLHAVGADVTISLTQDQAALQSALEEQFADGVNVVLDYLWGPSAEALLAAATKAALEGVPIRYVEIGAISSPTITLQSSALRSSSIELLGSGINSVSGRQIKAAIRDVLGSAAKQAFIVPVQPVGLERIGEFWDKPEASPRVVFTM